MKRRYMLGSKDRDFQFVLDRRLGKLYKVKLLDDDLFDLSNVPEDMKEFLERVNKGRKLLALLRNGKIGKKSVVYKSWETYGSNYLGGGSGSRVSGDISLLRKLRNSKELVKLPVTISMDCEKWVKIIEFEGKFFVLFESTTGSEWGADFDTKILWELVY